MKPVFVISLFLLVAVCDGNDETIDYERAIKEKIVGGALAEIGAAPYQISMRNRTSGKHFCGGAIISESWIATGAHCVIEKTSDRYTIIVGTNDLSVGGIEHEADYHIVHENFIAGKFKSGNDIALIRLKTPILLNNVTQPVEYSEQNVPVGSVLTLTGWGRLTNGGIRPTLMQTIDVIRIDDTQCREIFGKKYNEAQICTFTKEGEGPCKGDSGGPLVKDNVLVGIVSYGRKCAKGFPDVYTRVAYFYNWINSTIENSENGVLQNWEQ